MVQGLPELQRVHQGVAVPVGPVVLGQVRAGKYEGRYPPVTLRVIAVKPDILQVSAAAQIKGPAEDVGGF